MAKPGLDGHDRGAKVVARALRDAGFEVIYTGLWQTPEQIAETAVQEDADAVGLSCHSGAHLTLFPEVVTALRDRGADDVVLFGGGIIFGDDVGALEATGFERLFPPGTPLNEIDRVAAGPARCEGARVTEDRHRTFSGIDLEPVYGPEDLGGFDPARDLGAPGAYPMTRGVYPTMYRDKLWTMRQFAGFGSPAQTNAPLPLPARPRPDRALGRVRPADADGPRLRRPFSRGEVGRCGVAVDSAADMDTLFDGIPLGDVTTSMTINGPAPIAVRVLPGRRRAPGRRVARPRRDAADRHLQGVHRAEGMAVPAAAAPAADRRPDGVLRGGGAAVPPDQRERLPHPRGRLDRRAGARVHAGRRPRVRGARDPARPRRRRVRAAAVLLLQRAHRPVRGGREVPGGASDLGAVAPRPLRRAATSARGGCASTRRPPAARSPPSSPTTTSSAPRWRRSPPCSAARSRCTRTRSTRSSRCRPTARCGSRCAPSR